MSHQESLWLLQSIWEAIKALGPLAAMLAITWGVTK